MEDRRPTNESPWLVGGRGRNGGGLVLVVVAREANQQTSHMTCLLETRSGNWPVMVGGHGDGGQEADLLVVEVEKTTYHSVVVQ